MWQFWQAYKEAAAIRNFIIEERGLILKAKGLLDLEDSSKMLIEADVWRARLYNEMLEELGRMLDHWSPHLAQKRKLTLLSALDWYHKEGVHLRPGPAVYGRQFMDVAPGTWPYTEMSFDNAKDQFEKLEAVKWLKLPKLVL